MTPRVLNKHHGGVPPGAVYIGRPSKWGNDYSHLPSTLARYRVATRDQAVARYEYDLLRNPTLLVALPELGGKDLVCWCAPLACHGHVLVRLANGPTALELAQNLVVCDGSFLGCKKCGCGDWPGYRAEDTDPKDPNGWHEADCPLRGRVDVPPLVLAA